MKKLIVGFMCAMGAASAFAQANTAETVCNGTGAGANVTGNTDGSRFIRTTFTANCSTNTVMQVQDDGQKAWGAAASTKGQSFFGGSTNGGAVANLGACNSGKACGTVAAVTTALSTPLTTAAGLGNTN